jgi:hypothetical protein
VITTSDFSVIVDQAGLAVLLYGEERAGKRRINRIELSRVSALCLLSELAKALAKYEVREAIKGEGE